MGEKRSMMAAEVIDNRQVAPGHYRMSLRIPPPFATPVPGQFLMIREAAHREPLLGRPIGIYGFSRQAGEAVVDLLYRVAGRGTSLFSRMRPGEKIAVLGPLGSGFSIPAGIKRALLVAGGVGVAPLAFLLHGCGGQSGGAGIEMIAYLGAGSAGLLTGLERLEGACDLRICTDDGTRGHRGPVTDLLKRDLPDYDPAQTMIFACGPTSMIRAMGRLLQDHPIPCQVSLEERMACGLGACLGCAVAIRGEGKKIDYRRVCKDGPVFDLREIVFDLPAGV